MQENDKETKQITSEPVIESKIEATAQVNTASNQDAERSERMFSSKAIKQWDELKAKHPDVILLIRNGGFYGMFKEDAQKGVDILGLSVLKGGKNEIPYTTFPHYSLDTYLPKLVRAGERVAICDELVEPKRQQAETKAEIERQSLGLKR